MMALNRRLPKVCNIFLRVRNVIFQLVLNVKGVQPAGKMWNRNHWPSECSNRVNETDVSTLIIIVLYTIRPWEGVEY